MRAEKYVAAERLEHPKRSLEISRDCRIRCVVHEPVTRVHVRASDDHRGVALVPDLNGQRPGRAPLRVTRRMMCHEHDVAQPHLVAVVQCAIDARGRVTHSRIAAVLKVCTPARFDDVGIALHHHVGCTRQLLHSRAASVVIPVRVADQQDLHVTELEAQPRHARLNLWYAGFEVTVDEDVSLWRRDEIAREPRAADVVEVLRDAEWRERLRPRRTLRRRDAGARNRRERREYESSSDLQNIHALRVLRRAVGRRRHGRRALGSPVGGGA